MRPEEQRGSVATRKLQEAALIPGLCEYVTSVAEGTLKIYSQSRPELSRFGPNLIV